MVTFEPINLVTLVALDGWCTPPSNYERLQNLTVLTGTTATLGFGTKYATTRALTGPRYTLRVYDIVGNEVATVVKDTAPGLKKSMFLLNLGPLAEGWYRLKIECPAPETSPSWFVYRYVDGTRPQCVMPSCSGSYEVIHGGQPAKWEWVPTAFVPTPRPKPTRAYVPFSTALAYTGLHREYLAPLRPVDIHRPNVDENGILSTFNYQSYHWSNLIAKYPRVSLLDVKRGVGSAPMTTHLQPARNDQVLALDPWRLYKVAADGAIRTLCGWRHKSPPAHFPEGAEKPDLEVVGDWSAVPVKGFHEAWGLAVDRDSVATDPTAPPIGGEDPHVSGPRYFVADTQNNRVLLLTFSAVDRDAPPKVTEFLTGLADPWDVVWYAGVLYVSERGAHRVAAYNALSGAFLRVVVSGAALSHINSERFVVRDAPIAAIRAQPCVGPEGLAYCNGHLYFGSQAMGQVKKVNLSTGTVSLVCAPTINNNTNFVKLAVSDGTFGPEGTVFVSTWSNTNFGMPQAFLANGVRWTINANAQLAQGKGGKWEAMGYASAVGVGNGRLLVGSSFEGIAVVSKAQASDPVPNYGLYTQGKAEYIAAGHHLTHGDAGYGYYWYPLPTGSEAMNYYLANNA